GDARGHFGGIGRNQPRLRGHAHESLDESTERREFLEQFALELTARIPTEMGLREREIAVDGVVPREEHLLVVPERELYLVNLAIAAPNGVTRRPEEPPSPVEPTVEERADLLERLERLLPSGCLLSCLVLMLPSSTLQPRSEQ